VVAGILGDVPKQVEVILDRPPGNRARLIGVDTVREDRAYVFTLIQFVRIIYSTQQYSIIFLQYAVPVMADVFFLMSVEKFI